MRNDRLLWIVVAALGIAVLALALRHEQGTVLGLGLDTFASLVAGATLIFMVLGAVVGLLYHRLGDAIRAVAFWACCAGLLMLGYTFRTELQAVGDRVLAELVPGRPVTVSRAGDGRAVEVARARDGDFSVRVEVNKARLMMLVDTGATSVVLTPEAAKAAGLPVEILKFDVAIETANGRGRAAAVVLDRVAIGGIVERRVPALVSAPGDLKTSLLGMSFLNRLESVEIRGSRLVMRAKPVAP
jgi:aspartyl protease family protein